MNKEELLKEAKRRFPVGCTYYPVIGDGSWGIIIRRQDEECKLYEDDITHTGTWVIGSWNIRTPDGIWAKLVSHPNYSVITKEQKSKILQLIKDI